jgi:uncharacterized OsmC-like protein
MSKVRVTYDGGRHGTALKESHGITGNGLPPTGKGEEFSPGDLVGASLAGCNVLVPGCRCQK